MKCLQKKVSPTCHFEFSVSVFKFYVPEVDDTYIVSTIFLTYHENAYNYFEHKDDFGLRFLSAMDIVENPMVVFE